MGTERLGRGAQLGVMLVLSAALAACTGAPDLAQPAVLRDAASLGLPAAPGEGTQPDPQWWRQFGDTQLSTLIDQALVGNPNLKVAQARIVRAKAAADIVASARAPQLGASVEAMEQKFTATGMVPPPLAGSIYDSASVQLAASWEIDFFGKNRAALESALGQTRAAEADAAAARNLLVSNVAQTYFELRRLEEQVMLVQRVQEQRLAILKMVRARVDAGIDTRAELLSSEAGLPEIRLQEQILNERRLITEHALRAMIGQPNRPLELSQYAGTAINNIASIDLLSADLLARRPDVTAARWRVEAAAGDLNVARSQFYPNINLLAFVGLSSIGLDRLLDERSRQWGVGPALHLPVFEGGRLRANLRAKSADLDAAIESYNATVIEAVHEVVDQLDARQAVARQQTQQRAAQVLAEHAYALALQRYEAGLGHRLAVMQAEAAALNQRRQGVDLNARALQVEVALMRALGGGYRVAN